MTKNNHNPWVGLRAYTEGEILYGRDKDILELTTYVLAETEVVLYGKSGTGKSSIINAGVLPSARRNGYVPITIRLAHGTSAPSYLTQIINHINKAGVTIKNVIPHQSQDDPLLWEFFHCNEFLDAEGKKVRLLIIFDQFEEIFTLQECKENREQFFQEIADLLNDIKPKQLCTESNHSTISTPEIDIKTPNYDDDDIFAQIERIDINECVDSVAFVDNKVHFVFTLREDYLSDFEYYTQKIPALKQHRYAFRPIDDSQAMEIITKPQKGLVSDAVAKQIIAKVSRTSNGDSNSIGGIDTAILSLFLSQLYQRLPENAIAINADMLDKFGKNIIKDYYISAISNTSKIKPDSVAWLENILLTKDNHRDNKDIKDVLEKNVGLTPEELNYLEKEKHILTRFKRSKTTRIEFVHDVIADVAAQHKQTVEAEIKARAERTLQEKKAKRKLWVTIFICTVAIISVTVGMWSYMSKPTSLLPTKQSFIVSFLEDSLTTENEYWKGEFSIIGHRSDKPDTVLFERMIDKGLKDSIFKIEIDTLHSVSFAMTFPSYSKYQDIEFETNYSDLIKTLNIPMQLRKKQPKTYPYFGNVAVEANGIKWPVQNALVCLHDITTRTDSCGNFKYYLENKVTEDDDIFIIKKGFSSGDIKANDNLDEDIHKFIITPKEDIQSVSNKIAEIDSISGLPKKLVGKITNQKIYKSDGTTDVLNLICVHTKTVNKKYLVEGYFYFNSDFKKNNNNENLHAYYFFTGEIDRYWNDGIKNYSLEGENYIGNNLDITGTYTQNAGSWTGEITSPVGYNAVFPSPN